MISSGAKPRIFLEGGGLCMLLKCMYNNSVKEFSYKEAGTKIPAGVQPDTSPSSGFRNLQCVKALPPRVIAKLLETLQLSSTI